MSYGTTKVDTIQSSTASTPPTFKDGNGTEVGTLCRAWVNFNGTGTVAIRASFNVSSITDNGTGDYTVNFTTAMPDANYAWSGGAGNDNVSGTIWVSGPASVARSTWKQAGSLRVVSSYQNTLVTDVAEFNISVFR